MIRLKTNQSSQSHTTSTENRNQFAIQPLHLSIADFYTQTLLHTDAFTHRHFYTQMLLHTNTFTHRRFYTQKLLNTEAFTHRSFYTHTLSRTNAFAHRSFYTQRLLHSFYTQKLLHTDTFTHRHFYPQKLLHTQTHRSSTTAESITSTAHIVLVCYIITTNLFTPCERFEPRNVQLACSKEVNLYEFAQSTAKY